MSETVALADERDELMFPPQMCLDSAPERASKFRNLDLSGLSINQNIAFSSTGSPPKVPKPHEERPEKLQRTEWILSPTMWLLYRP